jgi:hypothetical protein
LSGRISHADALAALWLATREDLAQLLAGDAVEARRLVEGVAVLEFQARLDVRVERVPVNQGHADGQEPHDFRIYSYNASVVVG